MKLSENWSGVPTKRTIHFTFGVLCTLLAACSTEPVDGEDDSFTFDGKGDDAGLSKRETDAVLRVANKSTRESLDDDVALDARAARAIMRYRTGADGVAGTDDDRRFWTLDELDRVPYVGPVAFENLTEYAGAHDPEPMGESTLYFRAEEINGGGPDSAREVTESTPSLQFGATIERSQLRLTAESADYALEILATTSASSRLGGERINVTSPAISPTLAIDGNFYHWERGGSIELGCAGMGGPAVAWLYLVSLGGEYDSVKQISGNLSLQVVADDGSLFCTGI
jgi:hypothetical protein